MGGTGMHRGDTPRILMFGGTSEARALAEWLSARGTCEVVVSSLTEYGGSLVEELPRVHSITGRLSPGDMERVMREGLFACVVDATHPYAAEVTKNVVASARSCGLRCYRVLREGEPEGPWVGVDSAAAAAEYVAQRCGRVLLTTGSKDLATYVQAMQDYRDRLFVRVLPVVASLAATEALGIPADHVIAMKGPFSQKLNEAIIREYDISVLVTKASGAAGGFWEKVHAAHACGTELVVIHRPAEDEGLGLERLKQELVNDFGL